MSGSHRKSRPHVIAVVGGGGGQGPICCNDCSIAASPTAVARGRTDVSGRSWVPDKRSVLRLLPHSTRSRRRRCDWWRGRPYPKSARQAAADPQSRVHQQSNQTLSRNVDRSSNMLTGRRFRVEFTTQQAEYAEQVAAVCRTVWNTGLQQRREYRRRGAWMSYREQAHELADAKDEHPWLAEAPAHCLQQTLLDLDKASRAHGSFGVRWRSARRWRPSFRFPEGSKMKVERLNRRHARVKLPKLGWVRFRMSRSRGVGDPLGRTDPRGWALVCVVPCR